MTEARDPDKLTRIARMDLREIEEEFVSLADMQRRIMPDPGRVTAYADYDIYGLTLPTAVVGGDFYDFINLEGRFDLKDRFGVVIADAAGHGLVAAMLIRDFNTALYTAIAFEAAYAQDTTNLLFSKINRRMFRSSRPDQFISAFYAEVHKDGIVRYINAGHFSPLVLKRDRIESLDVGGLVLGAFWTPPIEYEVGETRMDLGDVLLGYTDGLIETRNGQGREYGVEALRRLAWSNRDRSAKEMCDTVMADVAAFGGAGRQNDDRTIIAIKKDPSKSFVKANLD